MSTKKKYKRDYIILEAKDMNFRYKDRVVPKAFAKVEVTEDKSVVALYVENLKYVREGYKVVAILDDYETIDLGNIVLSEQGKGEFSLNLDENSTNIKSIALVYEKSIPLIGFKGSKIDNYEEVIFTSDEEYAEYEDLYEDEYEYEYEEVDDEDEYEYEYEEVEYEEIDDEDNEKYRNEDNNNDEYYEDSEEITETQPKQKPQRLRNQKVSYINEQYNNSSNDNHEDINYDNSEIGSMKNLLMPRQIKKGLKMFKEVKPFINDTIDRTRWWKIEITPMTMCGYTMPYLGYINTLNYTMYSDIVLQSYRYRHYLFGVQYDEYNKRKNYIYAIPGNKNEQPDQGHTGFNVYKPCDDRNDKLGYWICFVDSRSRKIVK
ncbi:MAG: hypothetical protein J6D12_06430 [Peptostreptococcaceae bacterium]|nr:hypothetical protein [Peptostreptococcaceae bacterium]